MQRQLVVCLARNRLSFRKPEINRYSQLSKHISMIERHLICRILLLCKFKIPSLEDKLEIRFRSLKEESQIYIPTLAILKTSGKLRRYRFGPTLRESFKHVINLDSSKVRRFSRMNWAMLSLCTESSKWIRNICKAL